MLIMYDMTGARGVIASAPSPVFLRMTAAQRIRFRIAVAEEDTTYVGLLMKLLDDRDSRREKLRRLQSSPLHRPEAE